MTPEEKTIAILRRHGVDLVLALPCDRNKNLYEAMIRQFSSVELSREEEGAGIAAGALMAGARPAMLIQNSGLGNMINALASLTRHYQFALPLLMSWRGRESETIEAQRWMGEYVPRIMNAMDIPYHEIRTPEEIDQLDATLSGVFAHDEIRGYLFEPSVWKGSAFAPRPAPPPVFTPPRPFDEPFPRARVTRFELLQEISGALAGRAVVCNLGAPCKELYAARHQPSNFYMLGSMGLTTPIALGMALRTDKTVVAIDGDGSMLMNPTTLATVARYNPGALVILLVDNGAYGSTGDQTTAAAICSDLGAVARGFGVANVVRTADPGAVARAITEHDRKGTLFIHAICRAGNAQVPNIPLSPAQIRESVSAFLRS